MMRNAKSIRLLAIVAMVASLWVAGGCEKPLFPNDMPRTQYERYDRLRGRTVPAEQQNAYGGTEPALRERLSPPPQ